MAGRKEECPECGGSNFYITNHNNLGYCFNCTYTAHIDRSEHHSSLSRSPLLDHIRDYYDRMSNYYHSCLTPEVTAWLYQRGFTDSTIVQLRIGYCPDDSAIWYRTDVARNAGLAVQGKAFFANRVTFPYIGFDGVISDIRARTLEKTVEQKYKSPRHSAYFRGADYPYNYFLSKNKTLVLTEGEIKAAIAWQHGYPTIALPGMNTWRKGFRQQYGQDVIILLDTQPEQRYTIARAVINIAFNFDTCRVATLPSLGKEKMDIDSFLLQAPDLFPCILQAALPYETWLQFRY
jgi:DNA primase